MDVENNPGAFSSMAGAEDDTESHEEDAEDFALAEGFAEKDVAEANADEEYGGAFHGFDDGGFEITQCAKLGDPG